MTILKVLNPTVLIFTSKLRNTHFLTIAVNYNLIASFNLSRYHIERDRLSKYSNKTRSIFFDQGKVWYSALQWDKANLKYQTSSKFHDVLYTEYFWLSLVPCSYLYLLNLFWNLKHDNIFWIKDNNLLISTILLFHFCIDTLLKISNLGNKSFLVYYKLRINRMR